MRCGNRPQVNVLHCTQQAHKKSLLWSVLCLSLLLEGVFMSRTDGQQQKYANYTLSPGTIRTTDVGATRIAVVGLTNKLFEGICLSGGTAIFSGFAVNWFGMVPEPWLASYKSANPLFLKLRLYEVVARSVPRDTILIFADAFDVVYLSSPREVVSSFKEFEASTKTHVLLSAEKTVWPFHYEVYRRECQSFRAETVMAEYERLRQEYHIETETQYLNSGSFMGRAGSLVEFLSVSRSLIEQSEVACHDDQAILTMAMFRNTQLARLDVNSTIFFAGYPGYEDMWLDLDGMLDSKSRNHPQIFHANGLKHPLPSVLMQPGLYGRMQRGNPTFYLDGNPQSYQRTCGPHIKQYLSREHRRAQSSLTGSVLLRHSESNSWLRLRAGSDGKWKLSSQNDTFVPSLDSFEVITDRGRSLSVCHTTHGCLDIGNAGVGARPHADIQAGSVRLVFKASSSQSTWISRLCVAGKEALCVGIRDVTTPSMFATRKFEGAAHVLFQPLGPLALLSTGFWKFVDPVTVAATADDVLSWHLHASPNSGALFLLCNDTFLPKNCLSVDEGAAMPAKLSIGKGVPFRFVGSGGGFLLVPSTHQHDATVQCDLRGHLQLSAWDGGSIRSNFQLMNTPWRQRHAKRPVTVAILLVHYRKRKQLRVTLDSWQRGGLLDFVDERLVYIQAHSHEKEAFMRSYGFYVFGGPNVTSVGLAFDYLARVSRSDVLLIMEEDFVLMERSDVAVAEMRAGIALLWSQRAHVVRYRSRLAPGEPDYAAQWLYKQPLSLFSQPDVQSDLLCNAFHWTDDEDLLEDKRFQHCLLNPSYLCVDSYWCNWTNNPSLFLRRWWLKHISGLVHNCLLSEEELKEHSQNDCFEYRMYSNHSWWNYRNFTVALGRGLFTHNNNMKG